MRRIKLRSDWFSVWSRRERQIRQKFRLIENDMSRDVYSVRGGVKTYIAFGVRRVT